MFQEVRRGFGRDAGADEDGEFGGIADLRDIVDAGGLAGGRARDDQAIGAEEFGRLGGFGNREVRGDGVGGVFFFLMSAKI